MSSILSVHGWLDIYPDDLEKVKFFLNTLRNSSSSYNIEPELLSSLVNGWVIQESELNGSINLFYGRNIKGTNVLFMEKMIKEVIEKCQDISGFFKFEDPEEEYVLNWKIENGKIIESHNK